MRTAIVLATCAAAFSAPNAHADAADSARAETLFRDGKALMAANDFDQACKKLAESQKIEPGSGTLLALAICDERRGYAASSFAEFTELIDLAGKEGHRDRQDIARARLVVLAPTVAHISISIPLEDRTLTDLEMTFDGAPVARSNWGDRRPVNPGDHQITLSARDHVTWTTQISIAGADQRDFDAPILDAAQKNSGPQRVLGMVGIGVGAAAFVAGSIFGVVAIADHNSASSRCPGLPPVTCSNISAVNENDTARSFATASTVFVLSGIGVALIGISVYVTAPHVAVSASASRRPAFGFSFAANRVDLVGTFD